MSHRGILMFTEFRSILPILLLPVSAAALDCTGDPSRECLLDAAAAALPAVAGRSDWIDAALELAAAEAGEAGKSRLLEAAIRAGGEDDPVSRAGQLAAIAQASAKQGSGPLAADVAAAAERALSAVTDADKRADLLGKVLSARAEAAGAAALLPVVQAMPEDSDNQASFRARTLEQLATRLAAEDLSAALALLADMDSGLKYYQAVGYAHVATATAGHADRDELLDAIESGAKVARTLSEGYFVAGALREGAVAAHELGQMDLADRLFDEAVAATRTAGSRQQQARALSRVASELADTGRFEEARKLMPEALQTARQETSEQLRLWSFYEICGAAAFAGDFGLAREVLSEIPPDLLLFGRPLRAAAQRDLAWGLTRHGATAEAVQVVGEISSPRERVQALARMARLLADPSMVALPRYL